MVEMVLGIDPGKTGAVCLMDQTGIHDYFVSPVIGKQIDIHKYVERVREIKILCDNSGIKLTAFLENVHAIFGSSASSTFEFGGAAYMAETVLVSLSIPFVKVTPKEWQKKCWQGVKLQKEPKKNSLVAAKRLYPNESFLATDRSRVPHDGIIDAVLIAHYGLKFYNENL